MSALRGFTFDKEKLDILLGYWQSGQISQEDALDLKRLLEALHRRAIEMGDSDTEEWTENILIPLKIFLREIKEISISENIQSNDRLDIKKIVGTK